LTTGDQNGRPYGEDLRLTSGPGKGKKEGKQSGTAHANPVKKKQTTIRRNSMGWTKRGEGDRAGERQIAVGTRARGVLVNELKKWPEAIWGCNRRVKKLIGDRAEGGEKLNDSSACSFKNLKEGGRT